MSSGDNSLPALPEKKHSLPPIITGCPLSGSRSYSEAEAGPPGTQEASKCLTEGGRRGREGRTTPTTSAKVRGKVKFKIGERPALFLEVEIDNAVGECPGRGQNKIGERPVLFLEVEIDNAVGECLGKGQNKNRRASRVVIRS